MSIDDLARAAATEAHHKAAQEVDPVTGLERLKHTRRTRNASSAVGAVAVVAVLLVGGRVLVSPNETAPVPPLASATPTPTASDQTDICTQPLITCLGPARYSVALPVHMTVTVPGNFEGALAVFGTSVVEDYRTDVDHTGVTVFEDAIPTKDDAAWTRDATAGTTAKSMATWLSRRPFLTGTRITQTTIGGRTAWRVTGSLKPGAALLAKKSGSKVAPTFADGFATAAFAPGLTGEYTLLDLPATGVTVIWSWTTGQTAQAEQVLAGNRAYIAALSFGSVPVPAGAAAG